MLPARSANGRKHLPGPADNPPVKSPSLRGLRQILSPSAWAAGLRKLTGAAHSADQGARAGATPIPPPPLAVQARTSAQQDALEAEFSRLGLTYLHAVDYRPDALPRALNELVRYDATHPSDFIVGELTSKYLNKFSPKDLQRVLSRAMARPRPAVSIGPSRAGLGLFAAGDIPEGCVVGLYVGEVRALARGVRDPNGYLVGPPPFDRPNSFREAARSFVIDSSVKGNETRFINHSAKAPKLDMVHARQNGIWVPALIANRPIAAGEEITFDYGESYWAGREPPLDL